MDSENEQNLRDEEWQDQTHTPGDIFRPTIDEEILSEDGNPPSASAEYPEDARMPQDHPSADTDVDAGGAYFGGLADEVGYKPEPEDDDDRVAPIEWDHENN